MKNILITIFAAVALTACIGDPDTIDDDTELFDENGADTQSEPTEAPVKPAEQDGTLVLGA